MEEATKPLRLMEAFKYVAAKNLRSLWCSLKLWVVALVLLQAFFCSVPVANGSALPDALHSDDREGVLALSQNHDSVQQIVGGGMLDGFAIHAPGQKVAVSTVAVLTFFMAVATGLGAVPFFFMTLKPQWAGMCNGVASGVMLAASFDLIQEGQKHGGGSWVVAGLLFGGLFILVSQKLLHGYGEVSMLDVKGADVRKMILVVSIMTLHSFGEGSGVGVSFAGPQGFSQGLMVTIAIAVHNVPEGLAVSMVLSQQGLSPQHSLFWSIFTSLPQPIVAVPAFMCAEAFHRILPFCMGFAAGCMIWMVMAEVMPESFRDASHSQVATAATIAVAFMEALSALLESTDEAPSWKYTGTTSLAYLIFGLGPFLGGLASLFLVNVGKVPSTMSAGIGAGIAFVLFAWRPMQLLVSGKVGILLVCGFLLAGTSVPYILRKVSDMKLKNPKSEVLRSASGSQISPVARRAYLASLMMCFHAFAEGLALGVAAPKGFGALLLLPASLHGIPRGVAVGSTVYGGTSNKKASLVAAAITGVAGPLGAIVAVVTRIGVRWLDRWMLLACGSLYPIFAGVLLRRALKVDTRSTWWGILLGIMFAVMCLTSTRLVCLHTSFCDTPVKV